MNFRPFTFATELTANFLRRLIDDLNRHLLSLERAFDTLEYVVAEVAATATISTEGSRRRAFFVDTTAGNVVLTLPPASNSTSYRFKKLGAANTLTVQAAGSNVIDVAAVTSKVLSADGSYLVLEDHNNVWYTFSQGV